MSARVARPLDDAAESVRAFVHATLPGRDEFLSATDVYELASAVQRLAGGLDQALGQVREDVCHSIENGRIAAVDGEHRHDVAAARGAVAVALLSMQTQARGLESLARSFHNLTGALADVEDEDADEPAGAESLREATAPGGGGFVPDPAALPGREGDDR